MVSLGPEESKGPEKSKPAPIDPEEYARQRRLEVDASLGEMAVAFAAMSDREKGYAAGKPDKSTTPVEYPDATKWGEAALNFKSYGNGPGETPSNLLDQRHAHKMYSEKKHMGTLNGKLGVAEQGLYKINGDPEAGEVGRSALRIEGSLRHLSRAQRKAIEAEEKRYRKNLKKRDHAHHKLTHSGVPSTGRLARAARFVGSRHRATPPAYRPLANVSPEAPTEEVPAPYALPEGVVLGDIEPDFQMLFEREPIENLEDVIDRRITILMKMEEANREAGKTALDTNEIEDMVIGRELITYLKDRLGDDLSGKRVTPRLFGLLRQAVIDTHFRRLDEEDEDEDDEVDDDFEE